MAELVKDGAIGAAYTNNGQEGRALSNLVAEDTCAHTAESRAYCDGGIADMLATDCLNQCVTYNAVRVFTHELDNQNEANEVLSQTLDKIRNRTRRRELSPSAR